MSSFITSCGENAIINLSESFEYVSNADTSALLSLLKEPINEPESILTFSAYGVLFANVATSIL